jgi:lantibiotic biosynthesis protein
MIADRACRGYGDELRVGKKFHDEMSRRFRRERGRFEAVLYGRERAPAAAVAPLRERSATIAPMVATLRLLAERHHLTQPLPDLAMSFAHMHVNRLFRNAQRAQELVVYEMLSRIYSCEAARR